MVSSLYSLLLHWKALFFWRVKYPKILCLENLTYVPNPFQFFLYQNYWCVTSQGRLSLQQLLLMHSPIVAMLPTLSLLAAISYLLLFHSLRHRRLFIQFFPPQLSTLELDRFLLPPYPTQKCQLAFYSFFLWKQRIFFPFGWENQIYLGCRKFSMR